LNSEVDLKYIEGRVMVGAIKEYRVEECEEGAKLVVKDVNGSVYETRCINSKKAVELTKRVLDHYTKVFSLVSSG